MKKARNIAIIVGVILLIVTLVVDYSAIGTCVTLVSLDIVICIILHVISEKREEKECYNCKYLEFDLDLCTQFFCNYHKKLIKQDDSCENWVKKDKK